MMKKSLKQLSLTILTGLAATSYAAADNTAMKHDNAAMDHSQSDGMSSDMFLEKIVKRTTFNDYRKLIAWLLVGATLVIGGLVIGQQASQAADVVVYKSPTCGCCTAWVDHLQNNGFRVEVHDRNK